ncbi:hypothetical protein MRB53_039494 [Persea americana]|nr:hypothetical protein MRB53_039494 [Persea americana]
MAELPSSMRALVLDTTERAPEVRTVDTPKAFHGSAVVKIESSTVISYAREVVNGVRKYPFPMPLTPGFSAIARIAAVGPDSTKFKQGDLVFVDCIIHSRDEYGDVFLAGCYHGDTAGSAKLMKDVWRDWTSAEYTLVPLENVFLLDAEQLLGKLNYSLHLLNYISIAVVPYGGLKDINVSAGETVIIAPATGPFGGAAVLTALAMGANVVAMGRNKDALASLQSKINSPHVETVAITGNVEEEIVALKAAARGEADAFFDIGPPAAYQSSHITSGIRALRHSGRASLMAGYLQPVTLPYRHIMHRNITLRGTWMYTSEQVTDFVKLVETGRLDLSFCQVTSFKLEQHQEAFDKAAEDAGFAKLVVFEPHS